MENSRANWVRGAMTCVYDGDKSKGEWDCNLQFGLFLVVNGRWREDAYHVFPG